MEELQEEIEALRKKAWEDWKSTKNDSNYVQLEAYTKVLSLITKHLSKKQK